MRNFFHAFLLLLPFQLLAQDKAPEKIIQMKVHVNKITFSEGNQYRLELSELAGAYKASEELVPCLQKSVQTRKPVELDINPYTLLVKSCK